MTPLKQNINLYQQTYEFPTLSASRLLQIWGAVFILLMIIAMIQGWALSINEHEVDKLNAQQEQVSQQLQELSHAVKMKGKNQYSQEIAELKEKIKKTEIMLMQLEKIENANKKNYPLSSYLEGFAYQHVQGTELSTIYLKKSGQMTFTGSALGPQLIPQMLQSWHQVPSMSKSQLKKLQLEKVKANNGVVQFNMQVE